MDKNTFETFEYLPTNNTEGESDQFFVIQDDGTLLLNRQVQYVAEVQNENEAMDSTQACAVYDVNPQQFFVDVGSNSTELISVADNYILPTPVPEEVNSLYGNSFLLQTVGIETSEQAEKDLTIAVQFKEAEHHEEVDVVNIINKQGNTCTEITLSDEQYKSLEQKGWVLIESNGKIFILDAFGLHEVTTNHDLIQNLKDESKIDLPVDANSTGVTKDNHTYPLNIENIIQNSPLEQDNIELPIEYEENFCEREIDKENKINVADEIAQSKKQEKEVFQQDPPACVNNALKEKKREPSIHPEPQKYKNSKIKILTKYSFKDIPDKILLGRTRLGKKLIAKVVKRTFSDRNIENTDEVKPQGSIIEPAKTHNSSQKEDSSKDTDIDDAEFESLVRRAVGGELPCSSDEVVDASDVITQLFQVPEFRASVAGRNVVITRVTEKSSLAGTNRMISFVSGFVKSAENNGLLFIHVPHLLHKLTHEYEDYFSSQSGRSVLKPIPERAPDCKILQVHIAETKHNGVQAISFILNDRYLPCKLPDIKVYHRKINKLHACSACAAIFQSEAELTEHQESHAMESDGALTIDTDKLPKDAQTDTSLLENRYYIVKTNKGSEYCCFQCTKRFNKLSNCIRHMKITHTPPKSDKNSESCTSLECNCDGDCEKNHENQDFVVKTVDPPDAPYKCKMCPCAYYYPASLSKHISRAHIMDKLSTMVQTKDILREKI